MQNTQISDAANELSFDKWVVFAAEKQRAEQIEIAQQEHYAKIYADCRRELEQILAEDLHAVADKHPSTVRTYAQDLKRFKSWCDLEGVPCRPAAPEIVSVFLMREAANGAGMPRINRLHSAISFAHREKELYDPTGNIIVRATMHHIKRRLVEREES
jgi:site-specific recombinase XerD